MQDVFDRVLGNLVNSVAERGRLVYCVWSNRLLDSVLGQKWDEHIINARGDYCFVTEGTIKFWLGKKAPISEYKIIGGKYLKAEIEDCSYVALTFVWGTGNSREYKERQK